MIGELIKSAALSSVTKPQYNFLDTVSKSYRVLPQHIDFNMHINNAKYLEFFERGRWNHSVQTGSFKQLIHHGYNFIVAGIDVSYIRELNLFQSFDLETRYIGWDDKYFYLEQRCTVDGKIHAYALVKAVYTKRGKPVAPVKICKILDLDATNSQMPDHMALWKNLANAKREYSASPLST